ncbi:topoisomerase DNA-binding C4 zinc finger domain-containing protein [Pseudomonas helleri]|uniref:DNA topoisomerase type IA zn finger domain-containing protein n=1 Tax=Pseudomonas helleri TaxID=1608996 RepID=A0A7X2BWM0_9PSED|nr:topoisomerase DNA-binding C4 zinc finger domain-containing protein [Pseudomonas helleri]MQT77935.1 hypothetical protein [Pseudomonas helleri]
MIVKILKSVISNAQTFLVIWAAVIIANQLFIFGACFAPYCLIAAIPHTFVISALATFFFIESKTEENNINNNVVDRGVHHASNQNKSTKNPSQCDPVETQEVFCPKCGSRMSMRTATKGRYNGNKFWGCTKFPKCNGIINI